MMDGRFSTQDKGRQALIGAKNCGLLLQQAAIFLKAVVPAARLHAERLPQTAIGDAGRDRAAIRALVASRNTGLLLAVASHGGRDRSHTAKQAKGNGKRKQSRGNERISKLCHAATNTTPCIDSFRQMRIQTIFALNQIRISQWG
jgi:hypothetical protein